MKRIAATIAASVVALSACQEPAAPNRQQPPETGPVFAQQLNNKDVIPGQYIVVFRDDVDADATSEKLLRKFNAKSKYKYSAALKGFASELSDAQVEALRGEPEVAYIEEDQVVNATATQTAPGYGLDRIDERALPLSGSYTYTATASAVRAYIIDTGIQTSHSQFGGRASAVYDAFGGNGQDCNGHGTHVAGTVGSATYGVAKAVLLRGVRVLDCNGSGANSGVIAGINWVATNRIAPAVANLSLGGGFSQATNDAINNLANRGVFVAVAAGNENQNACNVSPASATNATTVAASTSTDAKASYSNFGSCVELYAPGSSIKSTWLNGGTNTISGTSMASPHVAGVGALYKATFGDASFSTIRTWIINNSTANVITGNVTGTPNKLLYKSTL